MAGTRNPVGLWGWVTLGRVLVAVGAPVAAAGVAFGVGWAGAGGWLGGGLVVLGGIVVPLAGLAYHAARAGQRGALLIAWSALPAAVGGFLALNSVDHVALRERGVEVTCVVEAVTSRVERYSTFNVETGQTVHQTTKYDHRLGCPPGGPSALTRDEELAKAGAQLRLVYDPRGEVQPEKPGDVHGEGMRHAVFAALLLAMAMGLCGALAEALMVYPLPEDR
ncbi:hypothetical protein OHA37_38580 [Streptomyces sp. NBC_00335]|uniref:hypothetical protein n=1 Tax=unclassified Streptomyces TaxID=2593676 RepID=UPI00224FE430|nr:MULTISPECIES: hypothetical protein [unclassified Streptomyces]MCX5409749.1 hypothetical protein [Streptomyces sp. NBC_00086]